MTTLERVTGSPTRSQINSRRSGSLLSGVKGPIAVNVFARLHDADAFLAVCRRMRLEGAKRLEITSA